MAVAFEVLNATLWNIVTLINQVEHNSCSLQLIRPYNISYIVGYGVNYGRESKFLDASINIMIENAIPIVLVDFGIQMLDSHSEYKISMNLRLKTIFFNLKNKV